MKVKWNDKLTEEHADTLSSRDERVGAVQSDGVI